MADIEAKLKFLQSPQAYGDATQTVACIETHMSWVFLVGQRVFKLKKSVHFPFLDFSNLRAREFYCREEIRLNARMAPGIYLGLFALQQEGERFCLVPETQGPDRGKTVDWLVLMRRLPDNKMLTQQMAHQQVMPQSIDALGRVLGHFYKTALAVALTPQDYLRRYQHEQALNREVLLHPQFRLRNAAHALDGLEDALRWSEVLLRERAAGGRIRDGHGDLRPDHVCLLETPVVIDCLEFNAELRQVDPFDELAFLGMECALAGAPWIGPRLMADLARQLNDHPGASLIGFYTAQRAVLRARLAMAHLLDATPRAPAKWPPLAERYLAHALRISNELIATRRDGKP